MTKSRIHLIIHGRVQNVFYRLTTKKQAKKLNLTGWVKNLPDRTVEIIAEGEDSKLKQLVAWCNNGPTFARVEKIDTSWEKYTGEFEFFSIRY